MVPTTIAYRRTSAMDDRGNEASYACGGSRRRSVRKAAGLRCTMSDAGDRRLRCPQERRIQRRGSHRLFFGSSRSATGRPTGPTPARRGRRHAVAADTDPVPAGACDQGRRKRIDLVLASGAARVGFARPGHGILSRSEGRRLRDEVGTFVQAGRGTTRGSTAQRARITTAATIAKPITVVVHFGKPISSPATNSTPRAQPRSRPSRYR